MKGISLTHRIVGAIVILSLAIIFIPLLLETDQFQTEKSLQSPVPEIPDEIKTMVFERKTHDGTFKLNSQEDIESFEQTVKTQIADSAKEVELPDMKEPAKSEKSASEKESSFPVKTNEVFEHTWVLQLASFSDKKKADAFRDKLRNANYVAFLDEKKLDSGKSLWRVRVGPYTRKSEASTVLQQVNKQFRVKGIIVQRR